MILLLLLILAQAPDRISIISHPHGLIVVLRPVGSRYPVCLRLLGVVFHWRVGGVIRWRRICWTGDGAINLCVPLIWARTALTCVLAEAPPPWRHRLLRRAQSVPRRKQPFPPPF